MTTTDYSTLTEAAGVRRVLPWRAMVVGWVEARGPSPETPRWADRRCFTRRSDKKRWARASRLGGRDSLADNHPGFRVARMEEGWSEKRQQSLTKVTGWTCRKVLGGRSGWLVVVVWVVRSGIGEEGQEVGGSRVGPG